MKLTMEGLPSGDIQAKYQKLAAEYSKVNCLRYYFQSICVLSAIVVNSLFPFTVEGPRESTEEGRSRRAG